VTLFYHATASEQPDYLTSESRFRPSVALPTAAKKAAVLSGFGPTSIWTFIKDGRLKPTCQTVWQFCFVDFLPPNPPMGFISFRICMINAWIW